MHSGFSYLSELVTEFFASTNVRRGFNVIYDCDISGWETWLQIEFAAFLSAHPTEPEWYREWSVEYDRRMEKQKNLLRPDFLIRKKGWYRDSYASIELKQASSAKSCIRKLVSDIEKLDKAKYSSLEIRTAWVLGVFRRTSKAQVLQYAREACEATGYEFDENYVVNRVIPRTEYAYCFF